MLESRVDPGSTSRLEVPLARLPTGGWAFLPLVVIHGRGDGPTLWLSAAIHGDELNGVLSIDELIRRVDPEKLKGTLIAVPLVNAFGLVIASRYLPDRRDLNRSFPGSSRGSLASRTARVLCQLVVDRSDYGIDFHTGSNGRTNWPQIRCNLDHVLTRKLARAFGAPAVMHSQMRPGSLRAYASRKRKPLLVFEAGEANRLSERSIQLGVDGTLRVMNKLGMIDTAPKLGAKLRVREYRRSRWIRASMSGFCRVQVRLGASVRRGEPLATIVDPATGERQQVKATAAGCVVGRLSSGLVHRGDALVNLARSG